MPLLSQLDLQLQGANGVISSFREAPILHTVLLNSFAGFHVNIPWMQLTSLTLHKTIPSKCVVILQQTLNLVHCHLSMFVWDEHPAQVQRDITLPCLKTLVLATIGNPFTTFLSMFIVPSLHTLQIQETSLGTNPIERLSLFTSMSGCKLQNVRITGIRMVPDDSFCKAFPGISFNSPCRRPERPWGEPVNEFDAW
ncbi:hypothetical protein B0H19DRAFT_149630 [Mycena capillaripes]|nr:hypothetical protein B0H19DRAFT_149630 [Mycena capillaripes]